MTFIFGFLAGVCALVAFIQCINDEAKSAVAFTVLSALCIIVGAR